jgi:5S rRNA maturation endonuclease (ribonuclease M5)
MLVKFFNGGQGKGGQIVDYLTREKDGKGVKREPLPEVLKGDPEQIVQIIDSLDFKYKYQTGVISFAPEDAPTEKQQQALMDSFENTAFAGLEPDQSDILWVRHSHTSGDRVELHFVTPRVELSTGKSLNIAPPGWQNYYCHWRDDWNYKEGWARPDDPNRARLYQPGYHAYVDAQNQRLEQAGLATISRDNYRKVIHNYIEENIKLGRIQNREDIIKTLQAADFQITRTGDDYLTVYKESLNKRIRLKGGIYDASWRLESRTSAEIRGGQEADRATTQQRINQAQAELRNRMSKRAEYFQHRYPSHQTEITESTQVVPSPTLLNHYRPLGDFLRQQLGNDAILNPSSQQDSQPTSREPTTAENPRTPEEKDLGNRTLLQQQRPIHHHSPQLPTESTNSMEMQRQTLSQTVEEEHDRPRKTTAPDLQELHLTIRTRQETTDLTHRKLAQETRTEQTETERRNQELHRQSEQTTQQLNQLHQILEQENRRLRESLQRHPERLRRIRMKQAEELETFKTQINLVEYAQTQGYEIDPKKSSQNCIVLKDHLGDKILVGIDKNDGHYFYYSVKDDRDKGSIIDFIQKRKSLNLGEVRKELRPWVNGSYTAVFRPKETTPKPTPTTKDRHKIIAQFENMRAIANHPYLNARGINQETIENERFYESIYADSRDNLIFPHRDREGVCGYEIRNQQFKGFSEGGTKGLWHSIATPQDKRLVICESPIDCLSYYRFFDDDQTRYFATGGTLSENQKDLIKGAFTKIHNQGGQIVIATDHDEAGEKLAQELAKFAPESSQISRHVPEHQKDWNEALIAQIREQQKTIERSRSRGPVL